VSEVKYRALKAEFAYFATEAQGANAHARKKGAIFAAPS
jgi:hypothetical protein